MAESYRGLTIRIGGDTTKLTQALHTANQAISGTQSSMKKLSDALKMDPTSLKASQLQVGEFAAQASNAATRLVTLNDAMRQVGDEIKVFNGSAATVREMASSWDNVNMVASQTRDYYAELTKTLATTYTEFSKTYSEASKMASIKITEGLSLDYGSFDQMAQKLKEVGAAFGANDKQVEQFTARLRKISERYDELCDKQEQFQTIVDNSDIGSKEFEKASNQLAKVNAQLEQTRTRFANVVESFKGFKSEKLFSYDSDDTDLASLAKALYQMVQTEAMTIEQADKMYDSFARMKDMWEEAFNNVKTANAVEGFKDLGAEAVKAEAKIASLVKQLVEAAKADATRGIAKLDEKLKAVSDAGDAASSRLKQALEVMKNSFKDGGEGPTGGQMTDAMRSYADAVEFASSKVDILEQEILKLGENAAVSNLAGSTRSLVSESLEAKQSYDDMAEAVTRYKAALNAVKEEQDRIKKDNDQYEKDERYQELSKQIDAYNEILKIASSSADVAKQKFIEMSQALTLREKLHDLETAKAALQQLQEMRIRPEVDVSALDGIKKAVESISKITLNADGLSKFREDVKQTANVMSDAEKRYKALSEAAKKDPTNSETLRQRTEAFNQVVQATESHIKAMRDEIAAIPSDRIDKAALAAGTAEENYRKAKEEVDKYKTAIIDINDRIDAMTKRRESILGSGVTSQDVILVSKLTREIEELKQRRDALAATGDAAFDGLIIAENTRRVQENTTAIQQGEAQVHSYRKEYESLGRVDATPKIDEAAFMQVVDRIAQAARRMASEIVEASDQIDSAYRDMRKTVNGTEEDYVRLREAAIEYSKDSFTSADQMLEMQALGGQLGVAVENLEQFGKIASNLDIATDLDAETVALKLGQISNILGLDIEGMQGFSDALVRLGNNMPAQESAIMAVAQRFGAVAATASFSGDEILGWSAAIAATGQRSEAAATAISNTVSGIEQAVANGGSDLKQFAAIANMSSEEFVSAWKDSPTEVLRSFIEGLKTLKDSDESAVAALENMGITGVRQQQTLLALTQTVDSLDDALLMSRNAWNGIDDQWGKSGDAANEAQRKAEGFSGALQILKNNAENLAAAFGESMVEPMRVLASALGIVTDAINAMPPFLRNLVVWAGAAGVAFSTLTPVLNLFGKGIGGALATMSQSAGIADFIVKVTGLEGVLMGAAEGGVNLISVLGGIAPVALGAAAAFGAIAVAGSYIYDLYERQKLLEGSTTGLTEAVGNLKSAYENYIPESAVMSVDELKTKTDETLQAQSSLAASMSEKWESVGVAAAMVDDLAGKITELSEKARLTETEQQELNAAVQAYNDITGSSISVIDEETGKLSASTEEIQKNADAWKKRAESEAAYEMYKDVVKQRIQDQLDLAEAEKTLAAEEEKEAHAASNLFGGMSFASANVAQTKKEIEAFEAAIASCSDTEDQLISMMLDGEATIAEMRDTLILAGESTEDFDNLTDEEMANVKKTYDGTADSIIAAIERVKAASAGLAGDIANNLEESSKAFYKAAAAAYKASAKEEYNQTKAGLDAQYKEAQRAQKAAYNARKTALDQQYRAAKAQYDREYDEQKKAFDKQYRSLKNKLDRDERALKESNDAKLKEIKHQNDVEEREFKNATDAYLHELEKRYKAAVKAAEDETDARIKAIDEQIRALKGQTTAEQNAIKEMKEDDKTAELQKAVDQAKSRRTREEAEKKLHDHLLEVQADRNERERKSQIEALELEKQDLKDALSEKKDNLQASYEEEKYQYKLSRDALLEELKYANDVEYETMKAKLDAEEQLQKERDDLRLENLKLRQSERLEEIKAAHDAELQSLKDAQSAELQSMQEHQSAVLEQMKADHTAQLQQLKAQQDETYNAIKAGRGDVEDYLSESDRARLESTRTTLTNMAGVAKGKMEEMKTNATNAFNKLFGITDTGGSNMEKAQDRHSTAMEGRMDLMNRTINKNSDDMHGTLQQHTDKELTELDKMYGYYGDKSPTSFKNSFEDVDLEQVANMTASSVLSPFEGMPPEMYTSGWDMLSQFNNGLVTAWNEGGLPGTIDFIAQYITDRLGFSVPKYGPMSNADKWGPDMVYLIANGIRDKEHILIRQIERMSDAMEEAFDPTLTVDAAYEALDTIGKNRSKSLGSIVETNSAPNVTINLSMNLSNVSMRSDADIDRLARVLSQEMATQATRQLAGRLG